VAIRRSGDIDHFDMVVYGLHLAGEIRRGCDCTPGRVDGGSGRRTGSSDRVDAQPAPYVLPAGVVIPATLLTGFHD
jgi:hypothetical protein